MTEKAAVAVTFEKHFYRVGEVAKLVGVEPHVIRYWERESRIVRTKKNGAGQRVFSRRDVERLLALKQLVYGEGYTLTGAVRQLALGRKVEDEPDAPAVLVLSAVNPQDVPTVRSEGLRRSLEAARADLLHFLAWVGDGSEAPSVEQSPTVPAVPAVPARRHERREQQSVR